MKIKISIRDNDPIDTAFIGWRCRHKGEPGGYDKTPNGMPEVRPSFNANPILFTEGLQKLSWELMSKFNNTITTKQWRVVYKDDIAFTNEQGFDKPGDPRADYINNIDLTYSLPKLMKAIIMGGSFYKGVIEGNELVMYPGIHGIDSTKPLPTVDEVIEKNWYFYAVSWHDNLTISPFPQGNLGHVIIPYVLRERTPYPLEWFSKWENTTLPNPYKFYEGF